MVNVQTEVCSHDACSREPKFNIEGTKTAVYCKQHAEDGMVNGRPRSCSNDYCTKRPCFNVESSKIAAYC